MLVQERALIIYEKQKIADVCVFAASLVVSGHYGIAAETTESKNAIFDECAKVQEYEPVTVEIKTPSDIENTIASGRHFKVSGTLEGEVPEDAA